MSQQLGSSELKKMHSKFAVYTNCFLGLSEAFGFCFFFFSSVFSNHFKVLSSIYIINPLHGLLFKQNHFIFYVLIFLALSLSVSLSLSLSLSFLLLICVFAIYCERIVNRIITLSGRQSIEMASRLNKKQASNAYQCIWQRKMKRERKKRAVESNDMHAT